MFKKSKTIFILIALIFGISVGLWMRKLPIEQKSVGDWVKELPPISSMKYENGYPTFREEFARDCAGSLGTVNDRSLYICNCVVKTFQTAGKFPNDYDIKNAPKAKIEEDNILVKNFQENLQKNESDLIKLVQDCYKSVTAQ